MGKLHHGLKFVPSSTPLDCGARLLNDGTFVHFLRTVWPSSIEHLARVLTLRDCLAAIPELHREFGLLRAGESSVVPVRVAAFVASEMFLEYKIPHETDEAFKADWATVLPWLADLCEATPQPLRLKVKQRPEDSKAVHALCMAHLMPDLIRRDDPMWYDHWDRRQNHVPPTLGAYLAALFILSNINRYSPEVLDAATREGTDLGYVLTSFLDCAERFLPQLLLDVVEGVITYFE
jgi:hypothetical protein